MVRVEFETTPTRREEAAVPGARRPWPWHGSLGAAILLASTVLFLARWTPVTLFFTPLAWTGYIALADAVVYWRRGDSLIRSRPAEFVVMLPWSVVCWLLFEFYNLHLHNWHYAGVPDSFPTQFLLGYWSFATVFPGVLETAALLASFGLFQTARIPPWRPRRATLSAAMALGVVLLVVPPLLPEAQARYWFGAVWLGVILLLDPVNYRRGGASLIGEWTRGRLTRTLTLLLTGVVTGLLWEGWNYWATARWVYTVPPPLGWGPRIFEMPPLGFLGFLPFAIEVYCLQAFLMTPWRPARSAEPIVHN